MDFGDFGRLRHRFGGAALYRAALSCLGSRQVLSLYLCTNLLHLPPRAEVRIWQELEVEAPACPPEKLHPQPLDG
jgi:hypothetical protein